MTPLQRSNSNGRISLLAAVAIIGICAVTRLSAVTDARDVFKNVAPSVVLIKTYAAGHVPLKIGSGFFISPGDALVTNAHVIAGAVEVEIVLHDGTTTTVTQVLALAPDKDIAILSAKGPPLEISERIPEVGEPIFVLGSPEGLSATFSNGIVSAIRAQNESPVIQITAPISPGSSGGPVVDEKGKVLGVASFYYKEGQNLNFAVGCATIPPMLAAKKTMPLAVAGYKIDEASKRNGSLFGQDRLTIVRMTENRGKLSLAIKNNETSPVYRVALRLLFYEDPREAQLIENKREAATLEASLKEIGRTTKLQRILAILNKDFASWTIEELATLDEFDSNVTVYPKSIRNSSDPYAGWSNIARQEIAKSKQGVENALSENGGKDLASQEAEIKERLSKLSITRKQFEGLPDPNDLLLVDYKDYILDGVIAPGLTKSFEILVAHDIITPTIVDYSIVSP